MRATSVLSIGSSFKRATISCNITKISISRSFATYKTSTGLAGLDVDPDALNTVHKLSTQILENVKVQAYKISYNIYIFNRLIVSSHH